MSLWPRTRSQICVSFSSCISVHGNPLQPVAQCAQLALSVISLSDHAHWMCLQALPPLPSQYILNLDAFHHSHPPWPSCLEAASDLLLSLPLLTLQPISTEQICLLVYYSCFQEYSSHLGNWWKEILSSYGNMYTEKNLEGNTWVFQA